MANAPISGLTALGGAPATGDLLVLVDISDTTQSANGTTKKMTVANLFTAPTFTGTVVTAASASGGAGLNMPHGAAPSAPVNGDIWTTTGGLFVRINGVTKTVTLT